MLVEHRIELFSIRTTIPQGPESTTATLDELVTGIVVNRFLFCVTLTAAVESDQ